MKDFVEFTANPKDCDKLYEKLSKQIIKDDDVQYTILQYSVGLVERWYEEKEFEDVTYYEDVLKKALLKIGIIGWKPVFETIDGEEILTVKMNFNGGTYKFVVIFDPKDDTISTQMEYFGPK